MISTGIGTSTVRALVAWLAVLAIPAAASAWDPFQSENEQVARGNELLAAGKAQKAAEQYTEAARSLPDRPEVHLNRGLALMRAGDDELDQAMQSLKLASEADAPDGIRARALSNLGNAFFRKEDYAGAVESYQKSLMIEPGNRDVAWNLELARRKKKEKEQQQEQDDEQKQDEQKQDEQKQDEQKQDEQKQDEQKQDEQKQDEQKQDEQKQDEQEQDEQKQDE
ncbi:MAG: tetratricopeptide repeat protein, partial [Polyangia bacterium]